MTNGSDDGYKVGYGKPPTHTQFGRDGRKGNTAGRPKGPGKREFVQKTLDRKVRITIDGVRKSLPYAEAILLKQAHAALAGDPVAIREMNKLILAFDRRKRARSERDTTIPAPPGAVIFYGVDPGDVDPETGEWIVERPE